MSVTFFWEPLDRLLNDDLKLLLQRDYDEIEVDKHALPHDPDWDFYREQNRAGTYRIVAARRNGRLIGYNSFFLGHHSRHRGVIFAQNDVLYLEPEQRRGIIGARFLNESARLLKEAGAVRIRYDSMSNVKLGANGGTLGDLFSKLGYTREAEVFVKTL
jgi:L-amino acid N-acyltransferase YncA